MECNNSQDKQKWAAVYTLNSKHLINSVKPSVFKSDHYK